MKKKLLAYLKEKIVERKRQADLPFQQDHEISYSEGAADALEELAIDMGMTTRDEISQWE